MSRSRRRLQILLPLLALLALWTLPSQAQVRRCTGPDGTAIYTDRLCADIGATDRVPHPAAGQPGQFYRGGCARNLLDLVYELTAAVDSHDVNRVAGLYHWVGMSSSGAVSVMNRLDLIAQRPLVDIVPVYPATAQGEGDYYPQATVRRAPIGLRLEQTLSNGSTPSRTMLGLRRYLGCWWVHL